MRKQRSWGKLESARMRPWELDQQCRCPGGGSLLRGNPEVPNPKLEQRYTQEGCRSYLS